MIRDSGGGDDKTVTIRTYLELLLPGWLPRSGADLDYLKVTSNFIRFCQIFYLN